jgi:Flp pilus assembly protein TadB
VAMLALLLATAAGWLALSTPDRHLSRIAGRPVPASLPRQRSVVEGGRERALLCVCASTAIGWAFVGPLGAAAGPPVGLAAAWWVGRLEPPSVTRTREQMSRDLPLAVDLLAACAEAGRPTDQALSVVSRAVGGALAVRLEAVANRLALGADPMTEWAALATDEPLSALGRTLARSLESGAPLSDGLSRLADDRRRDLRTRAQVAARNVGVKAAAPLALCFLPAFMLVGVVPTVAGAFGHLLS